MFHKTKAKKYLCAVFSLLAAAGLCSCSNEIDYVPFTGTSINLSGESSPDETPQTSAVTTAPDVTTTPAVSTSTVTTAPQNDAEPVTDEEYLESSLFIGDSLCSGLGTYVDGYGAGENILAYRDGRTGTMLNQTYEFKGEQLELTEAFEQAEPERVYFWLGTNELSSYAESFGENYRLLIEEVTGDSGVKVGIISIAPTGRGYAVSPDSINELNAALEQLADNMGDNVFYIDISQALADAEGYLSDDFDTGDGLHINKQGYEAISEKILSEKF